MIELIEADESAPVVRAGEVALKFLYDKNPSHTRPNWKRVMNASELDSQYWLNESSGKENENLQVQLDGIQATLDEASFCAIPGLIADMQGSLDSARAAIPAKDYEGAIEALEDISIAAKDAVTLTDFPTCDSTANYRGNFISRGLSAGFTVHDRFLHPDLYVKYEGPSRVGVASPL